MSINHSDFLERMPDEKDESFFKKIDDEIFEHQETISSMDNYIQETKRKSDIFKILFLDNCKAFVKGGETERIYKGGAKPFECIFGGTDSWRPRFFMNIVNSIFDAEKPNKELQARIDTYKDMWTRYWYPRFANKGDIQRNKSKALATFENFLNSKNWAENSFIDNKDNAIAYFDENYGHIEFKKLENNIIRFLLTGKIVPNLPDELIRGGGLFGFKKLFGIDDNYLQRYELFIWDLFIKQAGCNKDDFSEKKLISFYDSEIMIKDNVLICYNTKQARLSDISRLNKIKNETQSFQDQQKKKWKTFSLSERREIWADHLAREKTNKEIELIESEVQKNKRLEEIAEQEAEQRLQLEAQYMNAQLKRQAQQQMEQQRLLKEQMRAAEESQKASKALQDSAKRSSSNLPPKLSSFKSSPPTSRKKPQIVYAIQQGSNVAVYGENNVLIRSLSGILKGYTTDTFTIQTGNLIYIYNSDMTLVRSYKA